MAGDDALAAIEAYRDARRAGDAESALAFFSEDFRSAGGRTKDDIRASMPASGSRSKGLDLGQAVVAIDGGTATIDPVAIRSPTGGGIFEFTLRCESDGVWRCVSIAGSRHADPAAETARGVRERLLRDPARPGYHFVVPEGVAMPLDPNGAIYWKGRYHLFYIFQDARFGRRSDHWGHVSSTDLVHWRHHPTGLLEGMYSGNCFLNAEGVPTICYHQAGQGNAIAVALDDDLDEWRKLESNPITPQTEPDDPHHGRFSSWDPFAWVDQRTYYAIFGGTRPAVATSETLQGPWRYVGDLFAHGVDGVSIDEDVSCPELFSLGNKEVVLCISHRLGCRYYIGEWRDERFYPESHAQMSWVDNSFFAPESLRDDSGRRIMWAWILDEPEFGARADHGWSGTLSLPRVLTLGDDNRLRIDVPEELETLRRDEVRRGPLTIGAGVDLPLEGVGGDSLELRLELDGGDASRFGVKVRVSPGGEEETAIFYDTDDQALSVDTRRSGPDDTPRAVESGPLSVKDGERLVLRVFVDRSVVEVFANQRQAIARRIYPSRPDSLGVRLFSSGGDAVAHSIRAWTISPSNPY